MRVVLDQTFSDMGLYVMFAGKVLLLVLAFAG